MDQRRIRVVHGGPIMLAPVRAFLQTRGDIDVVSVDTVPEAIAALEGADVVIVPDPRGDEGPALSAAINRADSTVRWVQILSAGHAGLTSHPVPQRVVVTNQGGAISATVAEHGIALLLAITRNIPAMVEHRPMHEWFRDFQPPLLSLEGQWVTILGFGHIGSKVAARLQPFGVHVIGVNRSGTPHPAAEEMMTLADLPLALSRSVAVIVAVALTEETQHIIDHAALAALPPGSVLVNVSRGETVDQVALAAALRSGHLRAAAIDVTYPEPLPPDDPLWDAPNLLISPHTAGAGSTSSGRRIAQVLAENLDRFIRGEPLLHQVSTSTRGAT